ncbi:TRAP transporter large permease [Candidatus Entotheonella palauensis]|nr:TRAP transporter large permease [Candidatus Entotheonella palauensis]
MILLLMILAAVSLAVGIPFFASLVAPVMVALLLYMPDLSLTIVFHKMFNGIGQFALLAVPFFIFAAEIVVQGTMARRLIDFTRCLVGHLPGGLAMTTIVSCAFFGAVSGSTQATVAAVGGLMYPAMTASGYPRRFVLGLIVNASDIALLIPPSISMIIFGVVTGSSVASLFLGGIGPGIVLTLAFMIYAYLRARKFNLPTTPRAPLAEVGTAFLQTIWGLGVPVIIIGGIYAGIFTPTEAASVSVVYAIVVEVAIYRTLTWTDVYRIAARSATVTGVIFLVIAAASALTWLLIISGLPQTLSTWVVEHISSPIRFLLLLNGVLFIACMFIDPISVILISMPIVFPAAQALGIDAIHLGIVVVTNIAIGSATPPFGIDLFTASSIFNVRFSEVAPGAIPFAGIAVIGLLIVTYFPSLTLFLPRLLMGLQ